MSADLIQRLRAGCTDWDGSPMADETPPMDCLTAGDAREAATELERLTAELAAAQQAMKKQAASVELFREACRVNAIGFADANLRQRAERAEAEAASVSAANAILTAEAEGLRADAERWQWARVAMIAIHFKADNCTHHVPKQNPEGFDQYADRHRAAIDAARQAG